MPTSSRYSNRKPVRGDVGIAPYNIKTKQCEKITQYKQYRTTQTKLRITDKPRIINNAEHKQKRGIARETSLATPPSSYMKIVISY